MHTEVQPRQGLVHVPLQKVCESLCGGLLGMSSVSPLQNMYLLALLHC